MRYSKVGEDRVRICRFTRRVKENVRGLDVHMYHALRCWERLAGLFHAEFGGASFLVGFTRGREESFEAQCPVFMVCIASTEAVKGSRRLLYSREHNRFPVPALATVPPHGPAAAVLLHVS
jgi:hypothetical protein